MTAAYRATNRAGLDYIAYISVPPSVPLHQKTRSSIYSALLNALPDSRHSAFAVLTAACRRQCLLAGGPRPLQMPRCRLQTSTRCHKPAPRPSTFFTDQCYRPPPLPTPYPPTQLSRGSACRSPSSRRIQYRIQTAMTSSRIRRMGIPTRTSSAVWMYVTVETSQRHAC